MDRQIIPQEAGLEITGMQTNQSVEFYKFMVKYTDTFSLYDEVGTCPQMEVHYKLKDEMPFCDLYVIKRPEEKPVVERKMN